MSSPKAAAKTARHKVKTASASARKAKINKKPISSAQALQLAAELERGIEAGNAVVSEEARQKLMAALCKIYSQQIQAGVPEPALDMRSGVSPTDVMITASGLLKAADLQVFELGMWQSWTGR
jgi:hypothetical protein